MYEPHCEHLVFAGNGMAGVACVEELLKSGKSFDITIFGDEPHANYDRSLLASVLAGDCDAESITLNDIEWYQEHGIRTRLGIRVEEIDRAGRAVRSSDGDWTSYDKLILATGASPAIPAGVHLDGDRAFVFATLDDVKRISDAVRPGARAVVVGDWLASEVARGLTKRGCEVAIIPTPEAMRYGGRADLLVIATGLQPNTLLAWEAGLDVNRGIVVNEQLETSDPYIFAVGACTECNGQTFDSLPPLLDQAKVLAANLAGTRGPGFRALETVFQDVARSPLHQRAE